MKSLRSGKANIGESYAAVKDGELFLVNAYIPEYRQANRFNHETKRPRRLLLHAREIDKLSGGVLRDGLTIVPLRVYFNARGRAKVGIALAAARSFMTSARRSRSAHGTVRRRGSCAKRVDLTARHPRG